MDTESTLVMRFTFLCRTHRSCCHQPYRDELMHQPPSEANPQLIILTNRLSRGSKVPLRTSVNTSCMNGHNRLPHLYMIKAKISLKM